MMDSIFWREPLWLLLGLLPILLWLVKHTPTLKKSQHHNYADAHLLPLLIHKTASSKLHLFVFTIAWLLACIALAGPFLLDDSPQGKKQQAIDIALVVDISPSMAANDIQPSRLQRAQWELDRFVLQRPNDRFALITFSSNAYTTLPLTYDKKTVRHFLAALDSELPRRKGSNLTRALELAERSLLGSHENSRAIIVVSDGEAHNRDNVALARQLGEKKMPLLIWGIGTMTGAPVKNSQGNFIYENRQPVISKLQRDNLTHLASVSNGSYTELANDNSDMTLLNNRLAQLESRNIYQIDSRYTHQLFPWFITASLLLFSVLALKRAPLLVVCLIIPGLLPVKESLADSNANKALEALQNQNLSLAQELYQGLDNSYLASFGQGTVAYRREQWQQAITFFTTALEQASNDSDRAKAAYNLGNSHAHSSEFKLAEDSYKKALNWQNNYPRASLNLSLITQARALQLNQTSVDQTQSGETTTRTLSQEHTDQGSSPQPEQTQGQQTNPLQTTLSGDIEKNNALAPAGFNLDNIQEDTRTLLQKRFSRQDRVDQLNRIEDKPW